MNIPEKLPMHTPSLADENFIALTRLFPNAVTETVNENGYVIRAIDSEVLAQEINAYVISGKEERYQFTWPDKRKSILLANAPVAAALRPCREESVDFDNTENLYIEGDNLDVLKLLRETYLNRVKIIYIDPPYNTGKDFLYEDDFSEAAGKFLRRDGQFDEQENRLVSNIDSNGRFHTDWLNMIYPRLRVARDLLDDDGVIFISIDENEIDNLKKICSEIFGTCNFIGTLSVENNPKGRKNSDFISVSSEFLLIYAKNKERAYFVENVPKNANDMTEDENGVFVHNSGKRVLVGENNFNKPVNNAASDKNYSVYYRKSDKSLRLVKEPFGKNNKQLLKDGYVKYYSYNNGHLVENTYTEKKFKELFENGALEFTDDKIFEKNFSDTIKLKSQLVNREYEAVIKGRKQSYSMELTTTGAKTYLKKLFNTDEAYFDTPKNVGLLKILITLIENDDMIVLDFFSGSATTADAVMQLNAEDEGKRKFIMVQLPEVCPPNSEAAKAGYKNICEIGKERIRLAGKKIKEEAGLTAQGLDVGFRVLKLDSSNMKDVYYTPEQYAQMEFNLEGFGDNIKPDRTDEDLLFQIMLDLGIPLSVKIKKEGEIFFVNENYLAACFGKADTALISEIAKKRPCYAVFRDSSFESDSAMVNFEQVFSTYSPNTIRRVL